MSAGDAINAREMAQRVEKAMPTIQAQFFAERALLALLYLKNRIKWGCYGNTFEWYIKKTPSSTKRPTYSDGQLTVRTFEESDPANRCELPFAYIEKPYGVSTKSIEVNRHASGSDKIYDILAENLDIAKQLIFDVFGPSCYAGTGLGNQPSGLSVVVGDARESAADAAVAALKAYAGRTLTTAGFSGVTATTKVTARAGWDDPQFAPLVINLNKCQGVTGGNNATWAVDCINAIGFMSKYMTLNTSYTGIGKKIKPDSAFMVEALYMAILSKLRTQAVTYNVPIANKAMLEIGYENVSVEGVTCYLDSDVPADVNSVNRVFFLDSSACQLRTTHTKAEGIIKSQFQGEGENLIVSGALGVLRACFNFLFPPTAVGCIVGAD